MSPVLTVGTLSIEGEKDMAYLFHSVLLRRYSIMLDGRPTLTANVIEKAVDLHSLRVIGSAGYQKCISYLWKGWLVQDENDPSSFVDYRDKDNTSWVTHLDPDRMRAPKYQNIVQMLISVIYLALYTGAINTVNPGGDLDFVEGLLYVFTFGFLCDEVTKFWKAGYHILGFWNAFNALLYILLAVSLVLRMVALRHGPDDGDGLRHHFNTLSYNFLAVSAPMFWIRLLLYLDSFQFFGTMLVVLKVMMKESIIFFALLAVIIVGFLQSFMGLDYAEDQVANNTLFFVQAMANALMQSPDFSGFEKFEQPFGLILYYCFTFIVMVRLRHGDSSPPVNSPSEPPADLPPSSRSSCSTSSSRSTTRPTRTYTTTPTTSTSPSSRSGRCSSCARPTRTSSSRRST